MRTRTTSDRRGVKVAPKVSFLRADSDGWLPIEPDITVDGPEEQHQQSKRAADSNRKQLKECLHSVLSTPNLIVLAGCGASLGKVGGPSMQMLWDEVEKLKDFESVLSVVRHPREDKWIESLLSRCRLAQDFLEEAQGETVSRFLSSAERVIHKRCSDFIQKADLNAHETFLRRLARRRHRAPRLKVFTTNYDLCIETAASRLGIVIVDGFSYSFPRKFDPKYFSYDIVKRSKIADEAHDFVEGVIQLFKLHGSVNWDDTDEGIIQASDPQFPCLIYPTSTKYEQSYYQPHLELMSQFQSALREPNTCLVTIGFGFNDHHLSAPILSAVNSNPSFKLLCVDNDALRKSAMVNGVYSDLRKKIQKGEADILLLDATFEQFADLVPHLKALSPAEQIERSFREVAKRDWS